jgi:hypothetical protein
MNIVVGRNGKETTERLQYVSGHRFRLISKHYLANGATPWRVNGEKQTIGYIPNLKSPTINWASSCNVAQGVVYNDPKVISLVSNKARARSLMAKAGVRVPRTFSLKFGGSKDSRIKRWVKRPFNHQAGKDFEVVDGDFEAEHGYYYSQLIEKDGEFRVHVAFGKLLGMQEKCPRDNDDSLRAQHVWNHAGGDFVFKAVKWNDADITVGTESIKAIDALGLDYGAVDVIVKGGKVFVLEVNTSPSLSEYMTFRYALMFSEVYKFHCDGGNNQRMPFREAKAGKGGFKPKYLFWQNRDWTVDVNSVRSRAEELFADLNSQTEEVECDEENN